MCERRWAQWERVEQEKGTSLREHQIQTGAGSQGHTFYAMQDASPTSVLLGTKRMFTPDRLKFKLILTELT
jgi:hypothetical protein